MYKLKNDIYERVGKIRESVDLETQEVNILGLNLVKCFSLIFRTKNHDYALLLSFQKS